MPHCGGTQRKRGHVRRDHCKGFRRCIEAHWQRFEVLLGTLFASQRDFRTANTILSMESSSQRNLSGHSRRRHLEYMPGVCFPGFKGIRHWTAKLISWASGRIPMGTLIRTPSCVLDQLCEQVTQVLHKHCFMVYSINEATLDFLFLVRRNSIRPASGGVCR